MSDLDDQKDAASACIICGHRVVWHHDERGCTFHGTGPTRCPCRRNADQVVARIVYEALHRAADQWHDAIITGADPRPSHAAHLAAQRPTPAPTEES